MHSNLSFSLDDISLKDWDVKEQEGLREVERILDRTDAILEVRNALCNLKTEFQVMCNLTSKINHLIHFQSEWRGM